MKWFVYIIYSQSIDKFYVDYTNDLPWRIERLNAGWGKFTKKGIPWKLVYFEEFSSKSDAIRRERDIKRRKSRKYIEKLIANAGGRPDS